MRRYLLAAALLATLLATPTATAQGFQNLLDDFDQYQPGFYPPIPEDERVYEGYSTVGSLSNEIEIVSSPSVSGQALRIGSHTGGGGIVQSPNIVIGEMDCTGDTTKGIAFDFFVDSTVAAADAVDIRYEITLRNAVDTSAFIITLYDNDASLGMQLKVLTSTGAVQSIQLGTMTLDAWWHFEWFGLDCDNEQAFASMELVSGGSLQTAFVNGASLAGILTAPSRFRIDMETSNSGDVLPFTGFDNLETTVEAPLEPGVVFCADPSLEAGEDGSVDDFGYEYVEDWSYDTDLTGLDLEDGFYTSQSDGGSAYLGKGFDLGTEAMAVVFRIEAETEGQASVLRVAFTEGNGGTPSALTKGTGDGEGGNFDDHVGVRFEEEGNDWRITFRYNDAGAGETVIPASFPHGNPNTPTTYAFVVDSRDLSLKLYHGNHTAGTLIEEATMPAAFQDAIWEDQWFVATGTNAVLEAGTALDDQSGTSEQDQNQDSTCIFDLVGGAVASNTAGAEPSSQIPDDDIEPPAADAGLFGFLDSTLLIGFLLVIGVMFAGMRAGAVGIGLVAFFLVGMGLAYALGWMPVWLILVMFVACLAAVWFLPKPQGDGMG